MVTYLVLGDPDPYQLALMRCVATNGLSIGWMYSDADGKSLHTVDEIVEAYAKDHRVNCNDSPT